MSDKIIINGRSRKLYTGPRGGKYYISGGEKIYVKATTHSKSKSPKRSAKKSKSPKRSPKKSKSPVRNPTRGAKSSGKRGCTRQYTKKYSDRKSPAYPANECCGMTKTRYGVAWKSKPDKNGVCRWQKL